MGTTDADERTGPTAPREPSLVHALVPLAALVAGVGGALAIFGLDALDGPVQVSLILACMVTAIVALRLGHTWEAITASGQRCRR